MERLSSTHQAWSQPEAADLRFTTTATPEFLTGYLLLDYGAVFFAAAPARQPRIRPVDDWTRYDVDATVEFTLNALHRDWSPTPPPPAGESAGERANSEVPELARLAGRMEACIHALRYRS